MPVPFFPCPVPFFRALFLMCPLFPRFTAGMSEETYRWIVRFSFDNAANSVNLTNDNELFNRTEAEHL